MVERAEKKTENRNSVRYIRTRLFWFGWAVFSKNWNSAGVKKVMELTSLRSDVWIWGCLPGTSIYHLVPPPEK